MIFSEPLVSGVLLRRYKRFLADVRLDTGEEVTAHCPNTGSMLGLNRPGARAWLSPAPRAGRKLAWTWELVESDTGCLTGIHTGRANGLVREALEAGLLAELAGFDSIRPETALSAHSRVDFRLEFAGRPCFVEVKSVTAAVESGTGFFPDAVSDRARRHVEELAGVVARGGRAAVVFCVQRPDVSVVRAADHIDPAFGQALRQAVAAGVSVHALAARVTPVAIVLERRLPVQL